MLPALSLFLYPGTIVISKSSSLLSYTNSNTSHITIPFRQLIIQILGGMIIGIGAFKPLRKMVAVVLLGFLLAETSRLVVANYPITILATTFMF